MSLCLCFVLGFCHYMFAIGCATPRVLPKGKCGLEVAMVCQSRFLSRNKRTRTDGVCGYGIGKAVHVWG